MSCCGLSTALISIGSPSDLSMVVHCLTPCSKVAFVGQEVAVMGEYLHKNAILLAIRKILGAELLKEYLYKNAGKPVERLTKAIGEYLYKNTILLAIC